MKSVYIRLLLPISVITHQFAEAQTNAPLASQAVLESLKPLQQQAPPTMADAAATVQSLGVLYKTTFQGDKSIYDLAVAINELFKSEADLASAESQIKDAEAQAEKKEAAANHALTVGSSLTGPQPRQASIYIDDAKKIRQQAIAVRDNAKKNLLEKVKAVDQLAAANISSGNTVVAAALSASLYAVLDRSSLESSFSPSAPREWVKSANLKPGSQIPLKNADAQNAPLECPANYIFRDEISLRAAVVESAMTDQVKAPSSEKIREVVVRNIIDLNGSPLVKEVIAVDKIASNLSSSQLESMTFKDGTSLMRFIKHDLNLALQSGQISLLKPALKKLEEDLLPNSVFQNFASAIYSTRRNLSVDDIADPGNLVYFCLAGSFNGQDLRQTVCKRLFAEKGKDFPVSFKTAIGNEFGLMELLSKCATIRDATRRESLMQTLRESGIKMTESELSDTASMIAICLGGILGDTNFLKSFGFQSTEDANVEFILSSGFGIAELRKLRMEAFGSIRSR